MFNLNFPGGVMNALFSAASGDSLSPWNAPVQSSAEKYLFPQMASKISSMNANG